MVDFLQDNSNNTKDVFRLAKYLLCNRGHWIKHQYQNNIV